jgi:serine/threonine protein kinase
MTYTIGTPGYLAPDVDRIQNYTEKIDLWSVGCIFGELLKRKPLKFNNSVSKIKSGTYNWTEQFPDSLLCRFSKACKDSQNFPTLREFMKRKLT